MLKVLKWLGLGVAGLVAVVIIVVAGLFFAGRSKAGRAPEIAARPVSLAPDTAALARGRHLSSAITACEACHGPDLGGEMFQTPAILATMAAPNLTRGEGGIGADYTTDDWARALRHGIGKDGRRLLIMPSEAYAYLSDADAAALIAYLQALPPVDRSFPERRIGFMGGAMLGAGMMPVAVDIIPHDSVGMRSVAPGVTVEYGGYLTDVSGCKVCHGLDLRGRPEGPGPPPAPSLVAFVANNSAEAFRTTMRTGKTPSGLDLDPEKMPWQSYARMTDDELEAMRLYVMSTFAPMQAAR